MSIGTQLYDLRERNYPNKRGDTFRSLQVFICPICKAKTNLVVMGGYPGYGVRSVCPSSNEKWHHRLEEKMQLRNKHHPKSYREELEEEIKSALKKAEHVISDDIQGLPDYSLIRDVTNDRSS